MRKLRMDLIQRCVNENQSKVAKLRNDDTSFSEMRTTQNRVKLFFIKFYIIILSRISPLSTKDYMQDCKIKMTCEDSLSEKAKITR